MIHGGYKIMGMHFKSWLIDYKIWCSFLLAIGFIVYNLRNYVLFANAFGNGLQVLELYIANGNKSNSYIGVVIGCLFMLSDAPFTTSRSKYEVLRTGKLTWVKSQLAYITLSVVIYNILYLLLACIYSCISCPVGFNNEWSYIFRNLAIQQPDLAVWEYKISFPFPNVILEMDPWLAAVMTLIYNVAYKMCIRDRLRAIAGFLYLDGGEVIKEPAKLGMGVIIEDPAFLPNYTGLENLNLLSKIKKQIDLDCIRRTMLRVGLNPDDKRKVKEYSLGMKQNLAVAQAVMELSLIHIFRYLTYVTHINDKCSVCSIKAW